MLMQSPKGSMLLIFWKKHACRPIDSPMDPNQKLMADQDEPYSNPERYKRLVQKLIYLTITRPNISFTISVVSQFMQTPHVDH